MTIFEDRIGAVRTLPLPPVPETADTEQRTQLAEYPVPETIRVLPPAAFYAEPAGAEPTTQTDLAFYAAPE